MALPPDVAVAAARLSRAIFDQTVQESIDAEREGLREEYVAAVLLILGLLVPKLHRILGKLGPDSTDEEIAKAKAQIADLIEAAREEVAALHRPFLERMVELAKRHAERLGVGLAAVEAGIAALEAAVLRATQDAQRVFDDLIDKIFAALDRLRTPEPGADPEAPVAPEGFFAVYVNRIVLVAIVIGATVYVLVLIEVFAARGVQRVRFVHTETCETGPCEICEPLDGRIFPIQSAPVPPLHPRCDCRLSPIIK